jgi:ribonuclease HI
MLVTAYSDGSCFPNPGPGAHAAVILIPGRDPVEVVSPVRRNSTNNIEELSGPLLIHQTLIARFATLPIASLLIRSDSQYLVKGMTEWVDGWVRKGWLRGKARPVLNRDVWEALLDMRRFYREIRFEWVRGHNGDRHNEVCDKLCSGAVEQYIKTGDLSTIVR